MNKVIIESPYSGNIRRNVEYAQKCMADSLKRGEAPFLSHLLYTQYSGIGFVDDNDMNHKIIGRDKSIKAGQEWMKVANKVIIYIDLGITKGMKIGIINALKYGIHLEYRKLKLK